MNYKDEFLKIYKEYIKRDGSNELLDNLLKSDFFTAPASTRFHEAYEGGLVEHSVKVFWKLKELLPNYDMETIAICGLLHDVCKVNYYKTEMRNKKDENGKWIQVPYYTVDDQFPYGHGEKSVYLINDIMKLTEDEAVAIRFHMGAYEGEHIWNSLSKVFENNELAFYLHFADMKTTYNK